jgi:phage-related protein
VEIIKTKVHDIQLFFAVLGSKIGDIFNAIGEFFVNLWGGITDVFFGAVENIKNFFSWLGDSIKNIFGKVGEFFVNLWDGITGTFFWAVDGIKGAFGKAADFFKGVIDKIVEFFQPLIDIFTGIGDFVSNSLGKVGEFMGGVGNAVGGFFGGVGEFLGFDTGAEIYGTGAAVLHPNEVVVNSETTTGLKEFLADYKNSKTQANITPVQTQGDSYDCRVYFQAGSVVFQISNETPQSDLKKYAETIMKEIERLQMKKKMAVRNTLEPAAMTARRWESG